MMTDEKSSHRNSNTIDITQHTPLFNYIRQEMARPERQYLMLGDSDHHDPYLRAFFNSPALAQLFQAAAIDDLVLELQRELVSHADLADYRQAYRAGASSLECQRLEDAFWTKFAHNLQVTFPRHPAAVNISEETIPYYDAARSVTDISHYILPEAINAIVQRDKEHWRQRLIGMSEAGIRVHACDSWQWRPGFVPSDAERIFLGDREVADNIRYRTGMQQNVAILYGTSHLNYTGTLKDRLDPARTLHIDIYAGYEDFEEICEVNQYYTDGMPDAVYILDEESLIVPEASLYRYGGTRDSDEVQRYKDSVIARYGPNADPVCRAANTARIRKTGTIDSGYFHYVPA